MYETGMKAQLGISGSFDCLDKDGNILKTIYINGSIPLELEDKQDGIDDRERVQESRFRRYYRSLKWW